jgi:septum formation protein
VLTAVVLQTASGAATALSDSAVTFRALSAVECAAYWRTGEPRDKAGGYAIQGFGAAFVSALHGSYSGVMGLPLYETATLLRQAGIACWQPAVRA